MREGAAEFLKFIMHINAADDLADADVFESRKSAVNWIGRFISACFKCVTVVFLQCKKHYYKYYLYNSILFDTPQCCGDCLCLVGMHVNNAQYNWRWR